MVDNYSKIRELLEFRSDDDFYFLQILQRKKDHSDIKVNGTNNNSRLVKAYYVNNMKYFDFIEPEVKELCKLFGARAGINLNRRSYRKMSIKLLKKVVEQIENESFDKAYKAYPSVVGAVHHETDKRWILDIDNYSYEEFLGDGYFTRMLNFINVLQPKDKLSKFISVLPTKSGVHVITTPFNVKEFKEEYPEVDVHKNNPTNLYIT